MASIILNIKIHIRKEGALIYSHLPIDMINLAHTFSTLPSSFLPSAFFSSFSFFPLIIKSKVDLKNLTIPYPFTYSEI